MRKPPRNRAGVQRNSNSKGGAYWLRLFLLFTELRPVPYLALTVGSGGYNIICEMVNITISIEVIILINSKK